MSDNHHPEGTSMYVTSGDKGGQRNCMREPFDVLHLRNPNNLSVETQGSNTRRSLPKQSTFFYLTPVILVFNA